uniref:Uncharacterized protein n=1 Tax=Meloidogyne incognita TaxID=6306 RepID=A0A914KZ00_MELIC
MLQNFPPNERFKASIHLQITIPISYRRPLHKLHHFPGFFFTASTSGGASDCFRASYNMREFMECL